MKNLRNSLFPIVLFLVIFTGFADKSSAEDNWDISIAPYMWFTSMSGDASVNGNKAEFDASFSDLWDVLEFAAAGRFEAYYKPAKTGVFIDAFYSKLEDDSTVQPFQIPVEIKSEIEMEFLMLDEGIFYRFFESNKSVNTRKSGDVTIDGLFFGRIWYLEQELDLKGQGPVGLSNTISGDKTWFDFNLGIRTSISLTEKLRTFMRTDFGGFGLGFSSDFTWSGLGGFGYIITDHIEGLIGFRGLYVNYDDSSGNNEFEIDMWMYNPFIAINFYF